MPEPPSMQTRSTQAFFRAKADSWDRNYGDDGAMADRLPLFADTLARMLPQGGDVLDFGCGSGTIALHLAHRGWRVTGCDVTPEMIDAARATDADGLVDWVALQPDSALPFAPSRFDAVIASSVLEYVNRPGATIGALASLLRRDGVLLATVPDERHPLRRRERWRRRLIGLPGLVPLLRHTRWAEGTDYLIVSRNRLSNAQWAGLFSDVGLHVEPIDACHATLALVRARKV